MQSKRILHVLLMAVLIFPGGHLSADDRNLLPKYGGLPKPEWQKQADEAFIRATDEEYHGDRKKASMDTAARGWQFLRSGDPEDAMRRFNQAWLLTPNNGVALWGMAAVESDWGKFDESLKLFAEAEKFEGDDVNFLVDYARSLAVAGVARKDDALIKEAFERFQGVYAKAPQNTRNLQNWARALFATGKYPEAWAKVKLAEATPGKNQLDPEFLAALESRMPRPKD